MFENVPFFEHTHSNFAPGFMMIPNKWIWVQKMFGKKVIGKNKAKKCKIQKTKNSLSFLPIIFFRKTTAK
jgi:hypothetical protein